MDRGSPRVSASRCNTALTREPGSEVSPLDRQALPCAVVHDVQAPDSPSVSQPVADEADGPIQVGSHWLRQWLALDQPDAFASPYLQPRLAVQP